MTKRITDSNVVATVALFAALGDSSYAAVTITGKQVRDGSLSGRDVHIRDDAVARIVRQRGAQALPDLDLALRVESGEGTGASGGARLTRRPRAGSGIDPAKSAAVASAGGAVPALATVSTHPLGCAGWQVTTFEFANVNGDTKPLETGHPFTIVAP